MCSTFKWILAAAILAAAEQGNFQLSDKVEFTEKDLLENAPITRTAAARGSMTVAELTAAAVTHSDNLAANLLLSKIGGPSGLTAFIRAHGDQVTRLDRDEPMLNTNLVGDPRDTTSPAAMANSLASLLTTPVLTAQSRERLFGWMIDCHTGADRIRKGLPNGWRCGDKTGTCGQRGAVNDVAILWPPGGSPVLAAVYLSDSSAPVAELAAAHARIGQLIAARILQTV
jgi:beta-lactamase class A